MNEKVVQNVNDKCLQSKYTPIFKSLYEINTNRAAKWTLTQIIKTKHFRIPNLNPIKSQIK